mmetsp:Transcript_31198/g.42919  ORF Transcript_31198/g.42919 Transcript_31198/m.42919 type:complete len:333 (+) Transcript_31198:896-1894(+)
MEITSHSYDGFEESKSQSSSSENDNSFISETVNTTTAEVVSTIKKSLQNVDIVGFGTEEKRQIIPSSSHKKVFERSDSWQCERYKDLISTNLFDSKLKRLSSIRSIDSSDDNGCTVSRSSSHGEKRDRSRLTPTISLSSMGSIDFDDSMYNADWITLYPCQDDEIEEENPEMPPSKRRPRGNHNTKNSEEICKIFRITSSSVFDGETMKKKFTTDFLAKEAFVWINLCTRTLHWVKNQAERSQPRRSKYLLLKPNATHSQNLHVLGEQKGEVRSVMRIPGDASCIVLSTGGGDYLELQLPPASVRNWVTVLRRLALAGPATSPCKTAAALRP